MGAHQNRCWCTVMVISMNWKKKIRQCTELEKLAILARLITKILWINFPGVVASFDRQRWWAGCAIGKRHWWVRCLSRASGRWCLRARGSKGGDHFVEALLFVRQMGGRSSGGLRSWRRRGGRRGRRWWHVDHVPLWWSCHSPQGV